MSETLYGVRIGAVQTVPAGKIKGRHPKNKQGTREGRSSGRVFVEDIKQNGIRVPLTLDAEGYILDGGRRYEQGIRAGLKEFPVRYLAPNVSEEVQWEIVLGSNNVRADYTQESTEQIMRTIIRELMGGPKAGDEEILRTRAGGASDRGKAADTWEKKLAGIMKLSRQYTKERLASLRNAIRMEQDSESGRPPVVEFESVGSLRKAERLLARMEANGEKREQLRRAIADLSKDDAECWRELTVFARGIKGRQRKLEALRRGIRRGQK